MKTLGQVLIDAQRQFREGAATCGMAVEETLHEAEYVANAVLAHAIANAEPVGFLVKETGLYLDKELDGDIAYYRASGLTLLPHFTVPQPLPSVEEIAKVIYDNEIRYAKTTPFENLTDVEKITYMMTAYKIEALLKGEK